MLPNDWQEVKLSDLCKTITDGTHQPPRFTNEGIPFLFVRNIVGGRIDFNVEKYVSQETYEELTRRHRPELGDILFSAVGSFGVAVVIDTARPFTFQRHIAFIKPRKEKIDPYFLALYLNSSGGRQQSELTATGGSQRTVTLQALADFNIPLPPIAEQKRIASIAQKCDRLRRTRRYTQQLSDGYLRSVFLEMFGDPSTNSKGWDVGIIDDILASSQYGTSERSNSEKRGYPVLSMSNLTYSGRLNLSSLSYVELSDQEFQELKLTPGDVIFNRTNSAELVGKTAHWNSNIDAVVASYLVKLKLKKLIHPDYFVALLNSQYFKKLFQERCKKAIGQSNISPTLLREFPVLIPPLPLQEKFAQIVQRYERLRTQQREAERQAEHLFQTVLHRAFRGEL